MLYFIQNSQNYENTLLSLCIIGICMEDARKLKKCHNKNNRGTILPYLLNSHLNLTYICCKNFF